MKSVLYVLLLFSSPQLLLVEGLCNVGGQRSSMCEGRPLTGACVGNPRSEAAVADYADSFDPFDRLLFDRFAVAVSAELGGDRPVDYRRLIERINGLTVSRARDDALEISDRSKSILTSLFPPGLLPSYKLLFGKFPRFSAWMNVWQVMMCCDVYDNVADRSFTMTMDWIV